MDHQSGDAGIALAKGTHSLPDAVTEAARQAAFVERLAASIERAIRRETSGGVRDLRVEINDDGVLLRGRCYTYYCKQLAQTAAMPLSGGDQVTNLIEVS